MDDDKAGLIECWARKVNIQYVRVLGYKLGYAWSITEKFVQAIVRGSYTSTCTFKLSTTSLYKLYNKRPSVFWNIPVFMRSVD
jgi:hypothetical protein